MTSFPRARAALPLAGPLVVLALASRATAQAGDGWTALFDGKSLTGWKANENAASFQVVDGQIVAHGERSHLFYVGDVQHGEFKNFELEVEALTKPSANSGVFIHTRFQDDGWPSHGYEVQVNTSHSDEIKTGSLYGVVKVNPAPSVDDQWFTMNVRVVGRRITVRVDGKVVVDWLEPLDVKGDRRLSSGTFALQSHDPGSETHYRAVRVKALPDGPGPALTRADRVSLRGDRKSWWERMDYGPFVTSVVDVSADHSVFKGITVELTPERSASLTFDTDNLSAAAGWAGPLHYQGVAYDGAHGPQPSPGAPAWFVNPEAPGWSHDGNHLDQRAIRSGPMPKTRGKWLGLSRHGDDVVLRYRVGDALILEKDGFEANDAIAPGAAAAVHSITRSFELGKAGHPLSLLVCENAHCTTELCEGNRVAIARPDPVLPAAGLDKVITIVDRTTGDWSDLAMGAPVKGDFLDPARTPAATVRFVDGFEAPHERSGAVGHDLPRLTDGDVPKSADDPAHVVFFDHATGRIVADLGAPQKVTRINTYSWHRADRAPQRFKLWGSDKDDADAKAPAPDAAGWTLVAEVDSGSYGDGGKHGSCVTNLGGIVGNYRFLLWELPVNSLQQGPFLAETDVFVEGDELPAPKEPHTARDRRPLIVALVDAPPAAHLRLEGTQLELEVPAASLPCKVKLALSREAGEPTLRAFAGIPRCGDLAALTHGGPSLWPQTLTVQGVQEKDEKGDAAYVVDDVPVPFENPWQSEMRIGAFDLFADGKRAALCTWNGDVWIVSGIGGEFGTMTWKRFAAGLYEPLGLKIVDDVIYVNGRDQITRLHDLDGDGEADDYECFNNDVFTTRSFHEFTFDLQTDRDGNFYFAKAGPVRPGGRGFDAIVPHNGTVLKLAKDGSRLEIYATGLRAPNGIGLSPDGQVTTGDNEGTWVPHCRLNWLAPGSFQGVVSTAHRAETPTAYNLPLCWFPMSVDNSSGGQVWVTSDRWGPFQGELLHLSYGQSSIFEVMKEEVGGQVQGGVVRLPVTLGSSAMRGRFDPLDGQLYVSGLKGWQTNAARLSAFQRIRYTGAPVRLPRKLSACEGGLLVEFTCPVDKQLATDVQSYAVEQWNYVWGPMYGSPEVSVRHPDPKLVESALSSEQHDYQVHDKVAVTAARVVDDRRVFLEIPDLVPAMQTSLKIDLESADGHEMNCTIYSTIHHLAPKPKGAPASGGP
jgi:3-keto-disaccharide hydrolase/uncharacterized protein DUF6797